MSGAFEAITVVGGVLPPALLGRIQTGALQDETGLKAASYFLSGRETIGDAASRSWAYLKGAWQDWQDADAKKGLLGAGTGDARQRWLLILLRELGYGQVPAAGSELPDRDRFPVSHLWQGVPIHLLGPRVDLDKRNPGIEGAAKAPQKMLQEFLNHHSEYLWGILSNGLKLRLLRDSTALAGSSYVEFDLETIFTSDLYPEFQLLWQLCHQSRLAVREEAEPSPANCWLEAWRSEAVESGSRALDRLGVGVQKALENLGTGLLRHPDNAWLVAALQSQQLSRHDFHKALLRTAYRILFCFVVEDRGALLAPESSLEARRRYDDYFSTRRLRALSRRHDGGPHPDLWRTQKIVLSALGGDGLDALGLPPLGGLFDPDPRAVTVNSQPGPDLVLGCELSNKDLLRTVRALSWVKNAAGRMEPVDYRHLGAEELGSVYESLLELVPRIELETKYFELVNVAGNERKLTGSYYTPPGLVSALLDTALDPLLDEAIHKATDAADAEHRLLALTVCDPASGSGGFLVAAARRIARRLAGVRAGEDEPGPESIRHALHDVVDRCIYGVDMNDLAAELAKVSLWLEAVEPGKPLSFLDSRIKIGNSLIGATPTLMAAGIPDRAFEAIEGDDKTYASGVRKRNKAEGKSNAGQFISHLGQETLNLGGEGPTFDSLISNRERLNRPVSSVAEARQRAHDFADFDASGDLALRRLAADAWCASFVWTLDGKHANPPTNAVYRDISAGFHADALADTIGETRRLQREYRFFHWHIEFPEIFGDPESVDAKGPEGWPGGFSCLLGNPPWEKVKIENKSFFAQHAPDIALAPNAAIRQTMIDSLEREDSLLWREYNAARRRVAAQSHFLGKSDRFPLGGVGDVNTYAVFSDLAAQITAPQGRAGLVIQSGLLSGFTYRVFAQLLIDEQRLVSYLGFENEGAIFPDITNKVKFGLLTISGRAVRIEHAEYMANAHHVADLDDPRRRYRLSRKDVELINPNTGTLPMFRWARDVEVMRTIHKNGSTLINRTTGSNPWGLEFFRMFDMATDSEKFLFDGAVRLQLADFNGVVGTLDSGQRVYPLYEGKMLWHYDSRYGTYEGQTQKQANKGVLPHLNSRQHDDPHYFTRPKYWVTEKHLTETGAWNGDRQYGLAWRDVGPSERTFVSCVVPMIAAGHVAPIAISKYSGKEFSALNALWSSLTIDYSARQRGSRMLFNVIEQTPTLMPDKLSEQVSWLGSSPVEWLSKRTVELNFTWDGLSEYAADNGIQGDPYRWDEPRRSAIRAEIDAAVMHLFSLDREEAEWVLDSFRVLEKYERREHGEFRTKNEVLSFYDSMSQAIETGIQYESTITPPPGKGLRHRAKELIA